MLTPEEGKELIRSEELETARHDGGSAIEQKNGGVSRPFLERITERVLMQFVATEAQR